MSKTNTDPLYDLRNIKLPFDIDSVTEQCHKCVRRQIEKYKKFVDDKSKPIGNRFLVPCTGIPKQYIDPKLKSIFTTREMLEAAEEASDITKWAANNLILPDGKPWIARDYQAEILRCTSRKKVLRISRRGGKCIASRSNINTPFGMISPKDLISKINSSSIKPEIVTFDQNAQSLTTTNNYEIWSNGIKPVYELQTKLGRVNYITSNHPFLIIDNDGKFAWRELSNLIVGDRIATPSSYLNILEQSTRIDIGDRTARILGYLIGDGGTNYKEAVRISNISSVLLEDFTDIIGDYNCELTHLSDGDYLVVSKCKDRHIKCRNAINKLITDNDMRHKAVNKFIPKTIFKSTKSNICNFIAAYWDCDGWACVDNKLQRGRKTYAVEVGIGTSSIKLAYDIKTLLLFLGISSNLSKKKVKYKGKTRYSWQIIVADAENIIKFSALIPLRSKAEDLNKVLLTLGTKSNKLFGKSFAATLPKNICSYIDKRCVELGVSKRQAGKTKNSFVHYYKSYNPSKWKVNILANNLNDDYLKRLSTNDIEWDQIKSIKYIGEEETFDLAVPETHTLISDNIISHNTDGICVEICYYLFTEPGIRLVVAGPQKTHTEEIITRVRGFIERNPILNSMKVRDVSSPYYEIQIAHGNGRISRLRGYAAGTSKGGTGGISIRGQDADKIYLEELAYIDEHSIKNAILPLLATSSNTAIIGFSTPSGFDTYYRQMCERSPRIVEFFYNYRVLPHWREIEKEKSEYTEEEWTREFLAEFGASESGVYKPTYIKQALDTYEYDAQVKIPTWRYCIGTDWNEKHGTEIVVLGQNRINGRFKVVEAVLVPKSEFTQLTGIQRLLDLNRKWRPDFIYIDSGAGSTNAELLRKTAYMARQPGGDRDTARLLDILKKYDSGSSLDIKDPVTHEKKKVPAKPFMVNASVRMFEQNRINISSSDKVLQDQLKNYIIDRYTPTKTPVYGMENQSVGDHRLDALNLAIVAFHLEFDDLHKLFINTYVGAALDPRTGNKPESREGIMISKEEHIPEERRLPDPNHLSTSVLPGRVETSRIKTNRVGWDTDTEEIRTAEWLQRKRARGRMNRNRPKRTNF